MAVAHSSLTFTTTNQSLWKPGLATDLRIDTGDLLLWDPGEYTKSFDTGKFLGFGASATFYASARFGLIAYANLGTGGSFDATYDIDIAVDIPGAVRAGAPITFTYDYADVIVSNAEITTVGFGNSTDPDVDIGAGLDLILEMGVGFRDITLSTPFKDIVLDEVSIISLDNRIQLFGVDYSDPELELELTDGVTLIGRLPTGADVEASSTGSSVVEGTGFSDTKFLEIEADLDALLVRLLDKIPLPPVKAAAKFLGEVVFAEHSFDLHDYISFIPKDKIEFNFTLLDITASAGLVVTEDVKLDISGGDDVTPYLRVTLTSEDGSQVVTGLLGLEGQTSTELTLFAPANGIDIETITAEYEIVEAAFTHGVGLGISASITITVLSGNLSGAWVPSALRFSFGPLAEVEFPEGGLNIALGNFYEDSFMLADGAFNTATDTYDVFYSSFAPVGWDQDAPGAEQELFAYAQAALKNAQALRDKYDDLFGANEFLEKPELGEGDGSYDYTSELQKVLFIYSGLAEQTITLDKNDGSQAVIDLENFTGLTNLNVFAGGDVREASSANTGAIVLEQLADSVNSRLTYVMGNSSSSKFLSTNESANIVGTNGGDVLAFYRNDATFFDGRGGNDLFVADFSLFDNATSINFDLKAMVDGTNEHELTLSDRTVTIRNIESIALKTGDQADVIRTGYGFDSVFTGGGNDIVDLTADIRQDYIKLGAGDDVVTTRFVLGTATNLGFSDILVGGTGYDSAYVTTADGGVRLDVFRGAGSSSDGLSYVFNGGGLAFDASISDLALLQSEYFRMFPSLSARETIESDFGQRFIGVVNGDEDRGYLAIFEDIEVINFVDGGGTGNDLAMFMGGTRYEGGAGTDTFLADFKAYEDLNGLGNRGGVFIKADGGVGSYGATIIKGYERFHVTGTTASDVIEGGALEDYIDGGAGSDVLFGGDDTVADTIFGRAGNDVIKWSGGGADQIDAGADEDILFIETYGAETHGLRIELLNDAGVDGGAEPFYWNSDSFTALSEALSLVDGSMTTGSVGFSFGNGFANVRGVETINMQGSDSFDDLLIYMNGTVYGGGETAGDYDTFAADFSDQSVGIQFDLTLEQGVGSASGATLTNGVHVSGIERAMILAGSANDLLIGADRNDYFDGGAGADNLMGHGGTNTLIGGAGKDVFYYMGEGTDTVDGGDDQDYLIIGVEGQADDGASLILRDVNGNQIGQTLFDTQTSSNLMFVAENYLAEMVSGTYDFGSRSLDFTGIEVVDFAGSANHDDVALYLGGEGYVGGERNDGQTEDDTFVGDFRSETDDLYFTAQGSGAAASDVGQGTSLSGFERFVVTLGSGDDEVIGGDFSDFVKGGDGDDFMSGGAGRDEFHGGAGDDTYHYFRGTDNARLGDGDHDLLSVGGMTGTGALNKPILFGVANTFGNFVFDGGGGELVLGNPDGNLDVSDFDGLLAELEANDFNQAIIYADNVTGFQGVVGQGVEHLEITGSDLNDVLVAAKASSVLVGGAGDDFLAAYNDDADLLVGGDGDDTYVIMGKAGGFKVIAGEYDVGSRLHFTDFTQSQIFFSEADNDLYIDAFDGSDGVSVRIQDYFTTGTSAGLNFEFSTSDNSSFFFTPSFANGSTRVVGTSDSGGRKDEVFDQNTANDDEIDAREGNDMITGSLGGDLINGGLGSDGVSYINSAEGVQIRLDVFENRGGEADRDTLISVEQVFGSRFADDIEGSYANNTLYGGRGDDGISGQAGADQLYGGDGNDYVDGGEGNDLVYGEDGDDQLRGGAGTDHVLGGEGDDVLSGGDGNDVLEGGDGADFIEGDDGDDFHLFLGGFDIFDGGAGSDTTSFADAGFAVQVDLDLGRNAITSRADTVEQTEAVEIAAYLNVENAIGSAFADVFIGNAVANVFDGNDGDDRFVGGDGADTIIGGSGIDTIDYSSETGPNGVDVDLDGSFYGNAGAFDTFGNFDLFFDVENIIGSEQSDIANGTNGDNVIFGGGGNDTLYGYFGNDEIDGGDGDDTIYGGANGIAEVANNNILRGGAGNDRIEGDYGHDTLDGGADDDTLIGGGGDDYLFGGTGNDTLDGGEGVNIADYRSTTLGIVFDATAAQVTGVEAGTDSLTNIRYVLGGTGNDLVNGSTGDDTYAYFGGFDTFHGNGGIDRLFFAHYQGAIDLDLGATGAKVRGNGTTDLTAAPLVGLVDLDDVDIVVGSDFDDRLKGSATTVNLFGGGKGDDILQGFAGTANFLTGDEGDDVFVGFIDLVSGADTLLSGGAGFDTVDFSGHGTGVDYNLSTGDGDDLVEEIEAIKGSAFSDTLRGNALNNTFSAGLGTNFVFGESGDDLFIHSGGIDTYSGGIGSDTADFSAYGGGILFAFGTAFTNDTVQAPDISVAGSAEEIAFYDSVENIIATDFNDIILGTGADEMFADGLGDDDVSGEGGRDLFTYAGGSDVWDGGAGADTANYINHNAGIFADLRNGVVQSEIGGVIETIGALTSIETLFGTRHDDDLVADDDTATVIFGDLGDDVIEGGYQDDVLDGGEGNDTISYETLIGSVMIDLAKTRQQDTLGGGMDTLTGFENARGSGYNDILLGDDGDNILSGGDGNDVVDGRGGNDTLVYYDAFETLTGGDGHDTLDLTHFYFAVKADLGAGRFFTSQTGSITDGGLVQIGTLNTIESIRGSVQNDHLIGDTGNNLLEGDFGADILDGGDGDDAASYVHSFGGVAVNLATGVVSGAHAQGDTLIRIEDVIGSDHVDTLEGDDASNRLAGRDGNDVLRGAGGDDTLIGGLGDDDLDGGTGDDGLEGGEGDDTLNGDVGADLLRGGAGDDILTGGDGEDTLEGGDDDDTLSGGDDDDRLDGGAGDDTVSAGSGADHVIGGLGKDDLDGGTGIDLLDYGQLVSGVEISMLKGLAKGTGLRDTFNGFENVNGSEFNDVIVGESGANILKGGVGNDIIRGKGGQDDLRGGAGDDRIFGDIDNDSIFGGVGNDRILSSRGSDEVDAGDGDDVVRAGSEEDYVFGGLGDDRLFGNSGDDILVGGDGADKLYGGSNRDELSGGDGDDALRGDSGIDILLGEAGDDNLYGGTGADTFVYFDEVDEGRDRIKDWEDGLDVVNLQDFGFSSFAEISALASNQGDTDMRIVFSGGRSLLIENFRVENFDETDVVFLDF